MTDLEESMYIIQKVKKDKSVYKEDCHDGLKADLSISLTVSTISANSSAERKSERREIEEIPSSLKAPGSDPGNTVENCGKISYMSAVGI